MKVLLIDFDFPELSARTASALASHADVCLMLPRVDGEGHLKYLSPEVRYVPFVKPRLRQPLRQSRLILQLIRRIKRYHPDVVHLQKGHPYFNLGLPLLRQYPLVISIHDLHCHPGDRESAKTPQAILKLGYRYADQVIAHNFVMGQSIVDQLGIPESRVSVVPHMELGDAKAALDVKEHGHELLFFGRIWKYKGLEYLIRAQPLITQRIPQAKIVIAGRGDDFGAYRDAMANPECFEVLNEFVSEEKRAELFRRASVVVLPYIEATQSGVIPLAYTYAKPVVATTVGGLPSQVDDGKTGFLVPPGDAQALADKLVLLLEDPALRHRLGSGGKEKVTREWSADVVARRTLRVYHKALRGGATADVRPVAYQGGKS